MKYLRYLPYMCCILLCCILLSGCFHAAGESPSSGVTQTAGAPHSSGASQAAGASSPSQESTGVSLVVVAGIHSNAGAISLNSESLYQAVYNAAWTYGEVTIVRCDGAPQAYFHTKIPNPGVKGLSSNKLHTIAESYAKEILAQLAGAAAVTEEVDTLQALRLAGQALSDAGTKELLVLDSGLSTTGYLDYTTGLLDATPQAVTAALKEACALPDLTGVRVTWVYLGQVAPPQDPLTPQQEESLKAIWRQVLLDAGAEEVTFASDFAASQSYENLPSVSLVETEPQELPLDLPQLDQTQVSFVADSDQFLNPEAAAQAIQKVASYLLEHPSLEVCVVGTTASGDPDQRQRLSQQRAQAVCRVLEEQGVASSRLTPMGLGFSHPWHVEDRGQDGALVESLAQQNRRVLILDQNSAQAAQLAAAA